MESVQANKTWYLQNFYLSPQYPSDFLNIYDIEFERDEGEETTFKSKSYMIGLFDTQMVNQYESQIVTKQNSS